MREDGIDEIEVHVATLCVAQGEGVPKILIAQRTPARRIYPGLWECGGGQVRRGQGFEEAVKAQALAEFGLEVEVVRPTGAYKIETEGKVIPGMRFLCRPLPGQEVRLGAGEHTAFKWVTLAELAAYPTIPGLEDDVRQALAG